MTIQSVTPMLMPQVKNIKNIPIEKLPEKLEIEKLPIASNIAEALKIKENNNLFFHRSTPIAPVEQEGKHTIDFMF